MEIVSNAILTLSSFKTFSSGYLIFKYINNIIDTLKSIKTNKTGCIS